MTVSSSPSTLETSNDAWTVAELANDPSWARSLTGEHHAELKDALRQLKEGRFADGLSDFPPAREEVSLPVLGPLLATVQKELEEGFGVCLLKDFPLDVSEADSCLMFAAMLSHVGVAQPQTIFGEILQPVQDEGQAKLDERRGSKHNLGLPIHNDGCDVVGFLCRRTPLSGGHTILVSIAAVHNDMLENHPEALAVLYQPFHHAWQDYLFPDGRNTEGTDLPRTWEGPIFSTEKGRFCARFSRFYIDRAQTFPGVPKMTPQQIEALDLLDAYLADEKNWQYRRDFEPGDVLLLNNHIVLHSRTEFVNGEALEDRRQLYRSWLAVPNSRPLSESMRCFFGNVEAGAARRGGVKEEFMLQR
ncbi:MAG: TauD/TfdA family dioxygenase [Akkermansiaceae bacterium]|nr:TauD/TfdA family dioxygenase [Akkermansiaceae bacterium]